MKILIARFCMLGILAQPLNLKAQISKSVVLKYQTQAKDFVNFHNKAVIAANIEGPFAYWRSYEGIFNKTDIDFLRSQVRGVPNIPRVRLLKDLTTLEFVNGTKINFAQAYKGILVINKKEMRFDPEGDIQNWMHDIYILLNVQSSATNVLDILIPNANAMGAGIIAALVGLLALIFGMNKNRRKNQAKNQAHIQPSSGIPESYADPGMPELPHSPTPLPTTETQQQPEQSGPQNSSSDSQPTADNCPTKLSDTSKANYSHEPKLEELPDFNQKMLLSINEMPDNSKNRGPIVGYDTGKPALETLRKRTSYLIGEDNKTWNPASYNWHNTDRLHCSFASPLVFLRALSKSNAPLSEKLGKHLKSDPQSDGHGVLGRMNGNGFAFANMISDAKMGLSFEDKNHSYALPGDIVKMTKGDNVGGSESGHLAVFLGWKTEGDRKLICFYSANQESDGYKAGLGTKCVPEEKYTHYVFTRITNPLHSATLETMADTKDDFTAGITGAGSKPFSEAKTRAGIAECGV